MGPRAKGWLATRRDRIASQQGYEKKMKSRLLDKSIIVWRKRDFGKRQILEVDWIRKERDEDMYRKEENRMRIL